MVFGQKEQNDRTISFRMKNSNEIKIFKLDEINEIYKIIANSNSDIKRKYDVLDTIMRRKYYAK